MQCGSSTVEVKGAVVVPLKSGSMLSSQTIKFAATKGVQELSEYETAAGQTGPAYLEASSATGGFERAALKLTSPRPAKKRSRSTRCSSPAASVRRARSRGSAPRVIPPGGREWILSAYFGAR